MVNNRRRDTSDTSTVDGDRNALTVTRHASAYLENRPPFHLRAEPRPVRAYTAHGVPAVNDWGNLGTVRTYLRYAGSSIKEIKVGGITHRIITTTAEPHICTEPRIRITLIGMVRTPILDTEDDELTQANITIIPREWRAFRILCMQRGVSASASIREFIRTELDEANRSDGK